MAFPHLSQTQLRHLCNYFGNTLRGHSANSISMNCTVNLKGMFEAYSNGNESVLRAGHAGQWRNMRLWCCVDASRNISLYMLNFLTQSHVMPSLSSFRSERQIFQHNIKDSSQPSARQTNQTPADSQIHRSLLHLHSHITQCLHLKAGKHTNHLRWRRPKLVMS